MFLSGEVARKSVLAAVSAIEVYNKPSFSYREESFCLLLVNAWELLLKAKWILDNGEKIESLYVLDKSGQPKVNRTQTPLTHSLDFLAKKMREQGASGIDAGCEANLLALIEIRDAAVHFVNDDLYLEKRVLEIGTASLKNYLLLAREWFALDLSSYNFFIMPISFFHGFEAAQAAMPASYPAEVQALLDYLDSLESGAEDSEKPFSLRIESSFVRTKHASGTKFQVTKDTSAPAMILTEEDIRESYPLDYRTLTQKCKQRYANFSQNKAFNAIAQLLKSDSAYAFMRVLDPNNPNSSRKWFYSHAVWNVLDSKYKLQGKLTMSQTTSAQSTGFKVA